MRPYLDVALIRKFLSFCLATILTCLMFLLLCEFTFFLSVYGGLNLSNETDIKLLDLLG